jgi:hypothetical protein
MKILQYSEYLEYVIGQTTLYDIQINQGLHYLYECFKALIYSHSKEKNRFLTCFIILIITLLNIDKNLTKFLKVVLLV